VAGRERLTVPTAARRYCAERGCPSFAEPDSRHGRCRIHTTDTYRRIERYRGTAKARGYDADWRRVRDDVLRDEPFCRACGPNVISLAVEVDHVTPLAHGGARLDRANLQPLCRECHQSKTSGENAQRRA
jgi:5-methylcytosine-specific restriction protein A